MECNSIVSLREDWHKRGGAIVVSTGHTYKDAVVWWNGSHEWNWKLCGTSHSGGITPAAVKMLHSYGCEYIILSNGMLSYIKNNKETIDYLVKHNIMYSISPSYTAKEQYNKAVEEGVKAGILLHSTC